MSHTALHEDHETFRNELASVAADGRRKWVYARKPSGRYYRARTVVSWFLLAFLLLAPFVQIHGQPLMLLNVIERRFVLFGQVFWPQDFYLVVLIALAALLTFALVTTTVGRVWCGWMCPHTIFLEMVFRKIEYLIEGAAQQQFRRDRGPWTAERISRFAAKHTVFVALSFVLGNVFLAWVIGAGPLLAIITDPPGRHLAGLSAMIIFSGTFYAVFARFREQACILACPYGRVMSALIDRRTITVTYDRPRGEPRGKLLHAVDAPAALPRQGDCVDCHQCVTVCPTGIDIRNGLQLECVNCTACMDACDDVMQRLGRPRGLIRLTSEAAVTEGRNRWMTGRVKAYATVWMVVVSVVAALLLARPDVDVLVLRQPGTLFTTMAGGEIANFYTVQAFNRTAATQHFRLEVLEPRGAAITALGPQEAIGPYGLLESRILLHVPATALTGATTPVTLAVHTDGAAVQRISSSFVGPGGGQERP